MSDRPRDDSKEELESLLRLSPEELGPVVRKFRDERRKLKREYGRLYAEVTAILFRADPMGLAMETNTNEYEPEVGTILPRLRACANVEEVTSMVADEFDRWFGPFGNTTNHLETYRTVAGEIWDAWHWSGLSR